MFFGKYKAADQTVPQSINREPLPKNCEVLTTEWGSKVYVLGTNGFCRKCLLNVSKIIQQLRPSVVSLQCSSSKLDEIKLKEEDALKKLDFSPLSLNLWVFCMTVFGDGLVAAMLYKQMTLQSKETGLAPDADFRQAYNERKKIPDCRLHLADLPHEAVVYRTWGVPSLREKFTYARRLYQRQKKELKDPTEEHEIELDKEHREQAMEREFDSLPAFKRVLIGDRDRYLAYSLKKAAEPTPTDKTPVVVGIVRNEHLDGIRANWNTVDLDVDKLTTVERKYVVYEALKYGAVMMLCTHLITRKIRNRKAWDLYFNVKKKR